MAGQGESSPPRFLRLAGHPLRWRLLSELARSDRRVGELCALAGRGQSLVSYHLRQLREGGLVSTRGGARAWCPTTCASCERLASSRRGAAPRTAATATTSSSWRAAASCWPTPA